jgi:glycosyltransferase involved in cell wall biosynthesis
MVNAFESLGNIVKTVSIVSSRSQGEKKDRFYLRLFSSAPNWIYDALTVSYNLVGYRHLSRVIRSFRPDVIYERYSLNSFCGIWASRRYRIPLLLEVNAPLYYEQMRLGRLSFKRLAKFSERWICSNSAKTIVVSKVMKDVLMQEGIPASNMIVMHNGINEKSFNPSISGVSVRRKYGIADGKIVLGFVGWFRKWHGLEMLLQVVHEADLKNAGVHVLLVGDGPAYGDLHQYAKNNDLLDIVTFSGAVNREDIPSYIAAMDIAIQPSAPEYACPMKIIEYLGMAKCILAPDQKNITEILDDETTGFLFRTGDKESMRATLLKALADSQKRKLMGQRAHQLIGERELLWQSNARRVLSLLNSSAAK